jgi:hypothetical protein
VRLSIKKVRKGRAEHQRPYAIRDNLIAKREAYRARRRVESDGTTDAAFVTKRWSGSWTPR